MTIVARWEDDTAKAGRTLLRALVVIGGAAAACALGWLTATASAGTLTDGPLDAPAVVTGSVPVVHHAAAGAVADTARLAGALEEHVGHAVDSVPATVAAVRRIAATATGLTKRDAPARSSAATPSAGAAEPDDSRTSVGSAPRERSAGLLPVATTGRGVGKTAVAGRTPVHHRAGDGVADPGRAPWLPLCAISADAGAAPGHDRGSADVAPPRSAEPARPAHRRNGAPHRAVTEAGIQPGVTPD